MRGDCGGAVPPALGPQAVKACLGEERVMRVSVFGLGYVGCVSAACLASMGHEVIGVDVNQVKVDLVNDGKAPVVEERIGELIAEVVRTGALRATGDVREAIMDSEVSLVCVGTPSEPNGSLCTTYLERVTEQIGAALAERGGRHTVVFRSTMLPGTCLNLLVPILEKYVGGTAGVDIGVAVNPEFLREGTSVQDFFDPPKTVIGELDPASGDAVTALYDGLPGEVFRVPIPTAEAIKYADNAFHGLKIGFANELGAVCQALGVDSHQVMDVFLADRKLNISPAYLRPGFAFGGSCLPKDLRSLVHAAQRADVSVPILAHVLPSNPIICSARWSWSSAPASAGWACSGCPSNPAPTTSARARSSSWRRGSSARVTTCGSTTPT